jgi:hypothetical protein
VAAGRRGKASFAKLRRIIALRPWRKTCPGRLTRRREYSLITMPITRRQKRIFPMDALTPEQRRAGAAKSKDKLNTGETYGEDPLAWRATRREAIRLLHSAAHQRGKMTYSELVNALTERGYLMLDPHGAPLAGMLGQINVIEMERGDPMITAVVVLKTGSSAPGVGFWNLSEAAGLFSASASEEDQDRFWTAEFSECHRVWSARSPAQF